MCIAHASWGSALVLSLFFFVFCARVQSQLRMDVLIIGILSVGEFFHGGRVIFMTAALKVFQGGFAAAFFLASETSAVRAI